jgi:hypothetical protein
MIVFEEFHIIKIVETELIQGIALDILLLPWSEQAKAKIKVKQQSLIFDSASKIADVWELLSAIFSVEAAAQSARR